MMLRMKERVTISVEPEAIEVVTGPRSLVHPE
jgi:hypothetical protein